MLPELVSAPLLVMVSVPVLLDVEVKVPSMPIPRPDAPVTLMVMLPPL